MSFFKDWLKSDVPSIPVPDGKGGTTLLAPSQVRSGPELNAAWSVGMQQFIQQSNIRNINPTILAEHLTPQILRIKGAVLADRMDEIRRGRVDNENEEHSQEIGVAAKGLSDQNQAQSLWNYHQKKAKERNGGNNKEANDFVFDKLSKYVKFVSQTDPVLATTMATNLGATLINPANPDLGTIANRFPGELSDLIGTIKGTKREAAQAKADADRQQVDDIFQTVVNAQETDDITKSRAAFDAGDKALTSLIDQNVSGAVEARARLRDRGRNFNAITNERFGKAIDSGVIRTQAQAQEYLSAGLITADTYKAYEARLLTDRSGKEVAALKPAMEKWAFTVASSDLMGKGADTNLMDKKLIVFYMTVVLSLNYLLLFRENS
jgi:hypothetical protein